MIRAVDYYAYASCDFIYDPKMARDGGGRDVLVRLHFRLR